MNTLIQTLKLFPLLFQAVQSVENSAPAAQPVPGAVAHAVAASLQSELVDSRIITQDQLLSIIQAITVSIVSIFNIWNIFKTPAAPPAPGPVAAPPTATH